MSGGAPEVYVQGWRDQALLGRTTALEDVAREVVMFFRSPTVTGQSLVIDGGIHFD
jgi:enoyl-[acyl-carrier-protein] reductase (NADH)